MCSFSQRRVYRTGRLTNSHAMDTSDWASESDPGSKAWLMEAALSSDEGHGQICSPDVDANEDETNLFNFEEIEWPKQWG